MGEGVKQTAPVSSVFDGYSQPPRPAPSDSKLSYNARGGFKRELIPRNTDEEHPTCTGHLRCTLHTKRLPREHLQEKTVLSTFVKVHHHPLQPVARRRGQLHACGLRMLRADAC